MSGQIRYLAVFVAIIFSMTTSQGQDVSTLKKDQARLAEKIAFTSKLLTETAHRKLDAETELSLLSKQIETRKLLVKSLEQELSHIKHKINEGEKEVQKLTLQKENLTNNYSDIVRASYRSKLQKNRWLFLLSAHSMQQLYQRWRYLKQLNTGVKDRLAQVAMTVKMIDKELLNLKLIEQQKADLVKKQAAEKDKIDQSLRDQKVILSGLSKEESSLKATLKQHQKAQLKLKKAIMDAISTATEKRNNLSLTPAMAKLSTSFAANKNKLPWPVSKGLITRSFGKQSHPSLKNVTVNSNGIDIHTEANAEVKAIFGGRVVGQQFIPGYDHMIIVSHGSFYSVYSYLSESNVTLGDEIQTGTLLGSARTHEGVGQVHLEIWQGKELLNPESWLMSQ